MLAFRRQRFALKFPSVAHHFVSYKRHHASFRSVHNNPSHSPNGDAFKVLFFGRDEFSCVVLQQLYAASDVWQDIHIVTQPDVKTGRRGSKISVSPLKILGQQLGLSVHPIPPDRASFKTWQPPSPFSVSETGQFRSLSHLLITASFGRILPSSLLELFAPGRRLNVHPSLLPAYRGPAPIQHTLLDGRKDTGVCIIEMMERKRGIDAGEIWGRAELPVPDGSTFPTLRDTLARKGGELLVSVLRDMQRGKAASVPQLSDASAPRASAITAKDAVLDFKTMSAEDIIRRHRAIAHQKPIIAYLKTGKTLQLHSPTALSPLSSATTNLDGVGSAIYDPVSGGLLVRCANDTILSVPQVKQQDRSLLSAKQWWNGVRPEMRSNGGEEGPVVFVDAPE